MGSAAMTSGRMLAGLRRKMCSIMGAPEFPRAGHEEIPEVALLRHLRLSRKVLIFLWAACLFSTGTIATWAQMPSAPVSRFVVVLDPAHGGGDAGAKLANASSQAEAEKDFTLALSVRLRSLLAARGIQVVTTRESDIALTSDQRAQIANHAAAQACLVLHATMSGSGVHLFLSSLPPAPATRFLPWKSAQAAWVARSVALAGVLNSALEHAGTTVTMGRTALTTVDSMACPAIVVEIAPENLAKGGPAQASGPDEAGYEGRVAEALAAGLLEWRGEGRQP
jgi:N-acetylmuramoyl-L-alanine amidase